MQRLPAQALLPFGRKEKVLNRQLRQRAVGKKAGRGLGRPKSKRAGVSHLSRETLAARTALHVTVRVSSGVANLRSRKRFSAIKKAFVRFCVSGSGFRLVHFAVLSNHVHFIVEADSKRALSLGMQKLLHSISRRLNALSVFEHGGRVSTKQGSYRLLRGWLGRVFSDRYSSHRLKTPTEMSNAVKYVLTNAEHHYGGVTTGNTAARSTQTDPFTSLGVNAGGSPNGAGAAWPLVVKPPVVTEPRGYLLARACKQYLARRQR